MKRDSSPSIGSADSKRVASLKSVGWFVLVVIVVEGLAGVFLPEGFMTNTMNSRLAEISNRPAPAIQVMGDSVSAVICASILSEKIQDPVLTVGNYSLPGTSPIFSPFALERQLKAGREPRFIIYAPHPDLLKSPHIERFVGRVATASETLQLRNAGASWSDLAFGGLCKLSYTLRYRDELRWALMLRGFDFFKTWRNQPASVAASEQPFGDPPPEPDLKRVRYSASQLAPVLRQPFSVDPVNLACIHRFLDRAAKQQIEVLWVSMPAISAHVRSTNDCAAFNAFLDGLQAQHTNFHILHREIESWPDAYFADAAHLSRYGSWKFSQQLGDKLAAWLKANPTLVGSAKSLWLAQAHATTTYSSTNQPLAQTKGPRESPSRLADSSGGNVH